MTEHSENHSHYILKGEGSNFNGTFANPPWENFQKTLGVYSSMEKAESAMGRAKKFYKDKSVYGTERCNTFTIELPNEGFSIDVDLWEFDPH